MESLPLAFSSGWASGVNAYLVVLVLGIADRVGDYSDIRITDLAREYSDLAARVRQAFAGEYTTEGGRVLSDAATIYALALQWALLPTPTQRERAGSPTSFVRRASGSVPDSSGRR